LSSFIKKSKDGGGRAKRYHLFIRGEKKESYTFPGQKSSGGNRTGEDCRFEEIRPKGKKKSFKGFKKRGKVGNHHSRKEGGFLYENAGVSLHKKGGKKRDELLGGGKREEERLL